MPMDWVMECNRLSAELLRPTLHIFLDIPVSTAMARIAKNRLHTELYEKEERLTAVRANYFKYLNFRPYALPGFLHVLHRQYQE